MDPYKNGDSTYDCAVFGKHYACPSGCGCECHKRTKATPTVAEMAGLFKGGPDSVEWLRKQRDR